MIGLEESLVSSTITIYLLCLWYTLARRKHDTDIGSRLQVQARRDTLRGGSSRDDAQMSRDSDSLLRTTAGGQFRSASSNLPRDSR